MTNWGNEDDTNLGGNTELSGPKALRDAYEAQKQANQDLLNRMATLENSLTQQKVASTLTELGIPVTAAEQYKGEADPDKVREWATTMQSIFGGGNGTQSQNPAVPAQTLDPSVQQQLQGMNNAGQEGTPLGNADAALGRIGDATDIAGLLSAWQNLK